MTQEHPIRPPHELVQQWVSLACENEGYETWQDLATQAACWGADQELEACVEWMGDSPVTWRGDPEEHPGFYLREARRPKPPSLKETLLARVARIPGEGADAAYLRHWVDNESQRLVDLLHEVFKSLPS